MKEYIAFLLSLIVVAVGILCMVERLESNRDGRKIAAEARQEARDIAFDERQLERGCVQPESFESAHKRTD